MSTHKRDISKGVENRITKKIFIIIIIKATTTNQNMPKI